MSGFCINVAVFPTGNLALDSEMLLVKTALLYADRVVLYSPKAAMIECLTRAKDLPPESLFEMVLRIQKQAPGKLSPNDQDLVMYGSLIARGLRRKKHLPRLSRRKTSKERLLSFIKDDLGNKVVESAAGLNQKIDEILQESGLSDLMLARDEGLLEIKSLGQGAGALDATYNMADAVVLALGGDLDEEARLRRDAQLRDAVMGLEDAVLSGKGCPMFDERVASLVDASVREGRVVATPATARRSKHGRLACHVLDHLPIVTTSMEDLLNVRVAVGDYVGAFRSEIEGFAEITESEPWSDDFGREAEHLYRVRVVPAVQEIRKRMAPGVSVLSMGQSLAAATVDGVLGLAVASYMGWDQLVGAAMGAAGGAVVQELGRRKLSRDSARSNGLFFYYEAENALMNRVPTIG